MKKHLPIYAWNDFSHRVFLRTRDVNGVVVPLTTGSVTVFIAITDEVDPTPTPVHPSLQVNATHVGNGRWLFDFDGALLDPDILDPLDELFVIFLHPDGVLASRELEYHRVREAQLA